VIGTSSLASVVSPTPVTAHVMKTSAFTACSYRIVSVRSVLDESLTIVAGCLVVDNLNSVLPMDTTANTWQLGSIDRASTTQQVLQELRDAIIDGRIAHGARAVGAQPL
jgi:hypothetical protein